jgi:hypothetical protein
MGGEMTNSASGSQVMANNAGTQLFASTMICHQAYEDLWCNLMQPNEAYQRSVCDFFFVRSQGLKGYTDVVALRSLIP